MDLGFKADVIFQKLRDESVFPAEGGLDAGSGVCIPEAGSPAASSRTACELYPDSAL